MQHEKVKIPLIESLLYYVFVLLSLGLVWLLKAIIRRAIVEAMRPVDHVLKGDDAWAKKMKDDQVITE